MNSAEKRPLLAAPQKKVRFDALVFSRYVASCWIVAYHYYGQASWDHAEPQTGGVAMTKSSRHFVDRVFGWGTFWTQYFFFLSGFVLATARLSSRSPDELKSTWRFVAERLTTTYPAYLLALVAMLLDRGDEIAFATKYDWINFCLHLTLQQAWWPRMVWATSTYDGMTGQFHWNTPAWFMSALFFYWLLFKPLYRLLRILPKYSLSACLAALWLVSAAAAADMKIRHKSPHEANHDFYRFHPIMSIHIFFAGMVFARYYLEKQPFHSLSFSACLGYALIALFSVSLSVPKMTGMAHEGQLFETGTFYFLHNGGMLPIHALIVAGLCDERDPLTSFFKRPWCMFVGAASYAQYILQAVVFRLVGQAYRAARFRNPQEYSEYPYGPWSWQLVLPSVLFVSALTTHYNISVPCAKHLRAKLDSVSFKETWSIYGSASEQQPLLSVSAAAAKV